MKNDKRLRLAIQKTGRLNTKSISILQQAGITFEGINGNLVLSSPEFPLDLMLLRSSDIPEYVRDGVCDLGIVGFNVLEEAVYSRDGQSGVSVSRQLGFGKCRLSMAVPKEAGISNIAQLQGKKIATSYPSTLRKFLNSANVDAEITQISGSVEIAPAMGIADAICDLVSTGGTLASNGLKEIGQILESQAVLIQTGSQQDDAKLALLDRFYARVDGVMKARRKKYIMMNAPASKVEAIREFIPGMEAPTVVPLSGSDGKMEAIQAVAQENIFWETMEQLKEIGASSILVVPIEKIID